MKKISYKNWKSTNTRCENVYKKLVEEIEPLYKERSDQLNNLIYFTAVREHTKTGQMDINKLIEVRAGIMYKMAKIDLEIRKITNEMIANHKLKMESFLQWQKWQLEQDELIVNGFSVKK